jgi:hypothetical protein
MKTLRIQCALIGALLSPLMVAMVGCGTGNDMAPAPLSSAAADDVQLPALAVPGAAEPVVAPTASETESPKPDTL